MPKVRFLADFDFKPTAMTTLAYRAGDEKVVTTPCADAAIATGKAVAIEEGPRTGIAETIATAGKAKRARPSPRRRGGQGSAGA